jgi:cyclopropane fatty-acyl-phospholipid synthase-like methyltransferase
MKQLVSFHESEVMMNRFLYRMMYWLRMTHWDTGQTPPEVQEAFNQGNIPAGAALDLGCGTGTNVIFMAQRGGKPLVLTLSPRRSARRAKKPGKPASTGLPSFWSRM